MAELNSGRMGPMPEVHREAAGSRRTRTKYVVIGLITAVVAVLWIALDWEHSLGSDISPDGKSRADFSYSASGVIMLFTNSEINPDLHLGIVDIATGKVVARYNYSGDTASLGEARRLFREKVPWPLPDDAE